MYTKLVTGNFDLQMHDRVLPKNVIFFEGSNCGLRTK